MKCPRCTTEVLETTAQREAWNAASGELASLEIHMCPRCRGVWADHRQIMEILKRLSLAERSGDDRRLAVWGEQFERVLSQKILGVEEQR